MGIMEDYKELKMIENVKKVASEIDKYRKALEEIKKVIKSYDLTVDNGASVDTLYTIRKIINEVLDE